MSVSFLDYFKKATLLRRGANSVSAQDVRNLPIDAPASDLYQFHLLQKCTDRLLERGRRSPGPDGIVLVDLTNAQRNQLCNAICKSFRDGTYQSSPGRLIRKSKRSGGYREITIQNAVDVIAASLMHTFLQHHIDRHFHKLSFGGRPGKSVHRLLASLTRGVAETGRHVILELDLRKAFDNVNLTVLFSLIDKLGLSRSMKLAVKTIALAGRQYRKNLKGLPQGNPISMLLMNLYLHHVLDNVLEFIGVAYRYSDNLILLLNFKSESRPLQQKLAKRVRLAGLSFKEPQLVDLRRGKGCLFGLPVSFKEGRLEFELPEEFWTQLMLKLDDCHLKVDPPLAARQLIQTLFVYFRPCLSDQQLQSHLCRLGESLANASLDDDSITKGFVEFYRGLILQWQSEVQNADRIVTQQKQTCGASHRTRKDTCVHFLAHDLFHSQSVMVIRRRPRQDQRSYYGILYPCPIRGPPRG